MTEVGPEEGDNGTTQFVADGQKVVRDMSFRADMDNAISNINDSQSSIESLLDFLKKPIVYSQGTFAY